MTAIEPRRGMVAAYFTLVGLSMLSILVAWIVTRSLRIIVGIRLVVVLAALFAVPSSTVDPGKFPAVLRSFRFSALGTQAVLRTGIGIIFMALCVRAERKEEF